MPRQNLNPNQQQRQRPDLQHQVRMALVAKRSSVLETPSDELVERVRDGGAQEEGDDWEFGPDDGVTAKTSIPPQRDAASSLESWLVAEPAGGSDLEEEILDLLSPLSSALATAVCDTVDPETGLLDTTMDELRATLRDEYGEEWSTDRLRDALKMLARESRGNVAMSREQRLAVRVAAMDPDSLAARLFGLFRESLAKGEIPPSLSTLARELGTDETKIRDAQRQLRNLSSYASSSTDWESLFQPRPGVLPARAAQAELLLERLAAGEWLTSLNREALPRFRDSADKGSRQARRHAHGGDAATIDLHDYETRNDFLLATARAMVAEQVEFLEALRGHLHQQPGLSRVMDASGKDLPPRVLAHRKPLSFADSGFQQQVAALCRTDIMPDRSILSRAAKDRCMLLVSEGAIIPLELLVVSKSAMVGKTAKPTNPGIDALLGVAPAQRQLPATSGPVTTDSARAILAEVLTWPVANALTQDAIAVIMHALGAPVTRSWVKKQLLGGQASPTKHRHAGKGRNQAWSLDGIRAVLHANSPSYDTSRLDAAWSEYQRRAGEQLQRTRANRNKPQQH